MVKNLKTGQILSWCQLLHWYQKSSADLAQLSFCLYILESETIFFNILEKQKFPGLCRCLGKLTFLSILLSTCRSTMGLWLWNTTARHLNRFPLEPCLGISRSLWNQRQIERNILGSMNGHFSGRLGLTGKLPTRGTHFQHAPRGWALENLGFYFDASTGKSGWHSGYGKPSLICSFWQNNFYFICMAPMPNIPNQQWWIILCSGHTSIGGNETIYLVRSASQWVNHLVYWCWGLTAWLFRIPVYKIKTISTEAFRYTALLDFTG